MSELERRREQGLSDRNCSGNRKFNQSSIKQFNQQERKRPWIQLT